jgi:tetratricopeptide (TPR) repeat protein
VLGALDELLAARVLRSDDATYVFEAQLWRQELEACLDPAHERRACVRIADALARRGRDRLEVASYRLRAGQAATAIDLLLEELAQGSRWNRATPEYDSLLRGAIDACRELLRPRRDRMVLQRELIKLNQDLAASDLREHTLELLAELRRDSGLDLWEQPGGPTAHAERLQFVCERKCAQHAASAGHERGFEQFEALIALGVLVSETSGTCARTGDARLLDQLPSFAPFYVFSPALEQIDTIAIPACRAVVAGRYEEARALYVIQLANLLGPTTASLPEEIRVWGIRAIRYAIGNIDASVGNEESLTQAAEIENLPGWAIPAYSIRQTFHLTMGNLHQAERCRRQIERSRLQSAIKPPFAAAAVVQHVFVFSMAENPNGMRAAIPELEALARWQPGIRPYVPFARAEHARICGDYEEALEWIERAHQQVRPGDHPIWPWLVTSNLYTLFAQGRYEHARSLGLDAIDTACSVGLTGMRGNLDVPLALAEAKLGDFARACARVEHMIDERTASGTKGVALGMMHEARARIALWMNDPEAYERHAQLCSQHFSKSGGEPSIVARYERLSKEARLQGLVLDAHVSEALGAHTTIERSSHTRTLSPAVDSALSACVSREQRAMRALELIVSEAAALHGDLFLVSGDSLVLAASTAGTVGAADLIPALSRLVEASGYAETTANTSALELHVASQPDGSPTRVCPLLLVHVRGTDTAVAGVATLHFPPSAPVRLPVEVGSAVAAALVEAGDVVARLICGTDTTALH